MKHFEVQYFVGSTCFVYKTMSPSDAFQAVCNALATDNGLTEARQDDAFCAIAKMKESGRGAWDAFHVRIAIFNGEV